MRRAYLGATCWVDCLPALRWRQRRSAGGARGSRAGAPWTGYEPAAQPGEGTDAVRPRARRAAPRYENENFGGRRLVARDGAAMEYVGRGWNNRISSVACAPGCRLIAYQTIVFGGARANFTGARPTLGPVWNDRISALRVACDGDHAAASDPSH